MELIVKLSDTRKVVSLPSQRLGKLLQFYVNESVDLSGRIDWNYVRSFARRDYDNHFVNDSEYSSLLAAICDLCNFELIYSIIF